MQCAHCASVARLRPQEVRVADDAESDPADSGPAGGVLCVTCGAPIGADGRLHERLIGALMAFLRLAFARPSAGVLAPGRRQP